MKKTYKYALVTVFMFLALTVVPTSHAVKNISKSKNLLPGNTVVQVYPSLNRYKNTVVVYFKNLHKTSSVSYILSYKTNGKPDGASGTINTKGKFSLSRNLLLGTCSAGVCRYHKNITDLTLTVTVQYKKGNSTTQTYKIRI